jgi:CHASE2 domain-containing sensor protein
MPRIFINYRHADSIAYAELICRQLVEQFGAHNVFFDREAIDLGDEFARIIEQRVSSCEVLLAIIGPKWLTLADETGGRRLDQPQDYVRHEIAAALAQHIRVIPVLVGATSMPQTADLPADIAALAARHAQDVRDTHLDQDIEALIAALAGHKGFRRAFNALAWRVRLRRVAAVLVPACVFMMFVALWVSLFDYFTLDTKIDSYTLGFASWLKASPVSDEVALVVITADTERHFRKPFDKTWRHAHARLIDTLARAGAQVVAFDMVLSETSPYDEALMTAIDAARRMGTAVIFGTQGEPPPIPGFAQTVAGLGHVCVATRLGYAHAVPVAVHKADGQHIVPSLALLAAYPGPVKALNEAQRLLAVADGSQLVTFSLYEQVSFSHKKCPVLEKGDAVAQLIIEFHPLALLRDPARRYRYEDLADPPDGMVDQRLQGRIVLVGRETEQDMIAVFRGLRTEERYGFEVHADTLTTLLRGIHIQPLSPWGQLGIMGAMGALGASARFVRPFASPLARRVYCLALVAAYLAASLWVYLVYQLLLNILYHLGAFFLAYWALEQAKRRMGLWASHHDREAGVLSSPTC